MKLFHLIIFIIVFCAIFQSTQLNANAAEDELEIKKLKEFEHCLLQHHVDLSKICKKGSCADYDLYNYQILKKYGIYYPPLYFLPTQVLDVQHAIICSNLLQISLVPKGGGHSFEKYSFGNSKSIILDLQKMSSIQIYKENGTADVGPGVLLGPLQLSLYKNGNFLLPVGSCPTVGVSGLTLGGGYGFFSRKYGLTVDNLIEAQVVIANGEALIANENENSDLFFALRGAGAGSFGVVTKFTFKLHKVPQKVRLTKLFYDLADFSKVFRSFERYFTHSENELTMPDSIFPKLTIFKNEVLLTLTDSEPEANYNLEFPATNNSVVKLLSYEDFIVEMTEVTPGERLKSAVKSMNDFSKLTRQSKAQSYKFAKSFFGNKPVSDKSLEVMSQLMGNVPNSTVVYFKGFGGQISRIPLNETSYIHRDEKSYMSFPICATFGDDEVEFKECKNWITNFFNVLQKLSGHSESYQNYIDGELDDWIERYYGSKSNIERLVAVKNEYDPENFFNNTQSIPTSYKLI